MPTFFHLDPKSHGRTTDAMQNKWATLRPIFTVAVRNYEKSGQSESDVFPEFASDDPITSYIFCVSNIFHQSNLLCAKLKTVTAQSVT